MAFKPDHGLLEEMGSRIKKAISVAVLEVKQKEIVFGNSVVLSHVAWDSDPGHDLEMVVIIQQQIIGSPNIITRFLTLTVKSLIFYRTIKRTDFCTSSAPKYHCRCPRKQFS